MSNAKNTNRSRINKLQCFIGVVSGTANSGGEVVVVVVAVLVVMVVVVGYWWWRNVSGSGGTAFKMVAVVKVVGAL